MSLTKVRHKSRVHDHGLAPKKATQNSQYQKLFECAQDGILILSYPEGNIQDANPFFLELLGYQKDELLGKKLWELGFIHDKDAALKAYSDLIENNYVRYENLSLQTRAGREIEVEFVSNVYQVERQNVIQCNIRDVSERKRAERLLDQALKRNIDHLYEVIVTLSNLIEARDPYTAGHQWRVSDLSFAISQEMGLAQDVAEGIRVSALVHDIGKISVPAELLTKSNSLIDAEIEILKNHVITGYEILKALQFPWTVADFVLQHHERENGSGYPHQLMSKDIFLEAKIIAVADTVEAMTSHRPYRQAPGIELALAEIEQGSGTLYDPLVVATCLRLFREKNYQFPIHQSVLYQALPQRVKLAS